MKRSRSQRSLIDVERGKTPCGLVQCSFKLVGTIILVCNPGVDTNIFWYSFDDKSAKFLKTSIMKVGPGYQIGNENQQIIIIVNLYTIHHKVREKLTRALFYGTQL